VLVADWRVGLCTGERAVAIGPDHEAPELSPRG
jgi:hypothetical protein